MNAYEQVEQARLDGTISNAEAYEITADMGCEQS